MELPQHQPGIIRTSPCKLDHADLAADILLRNNLTPESTQRVAIRLLADFAVSVLHSDGQLIYTSAVFY